MVDDGKVLKNIQMNKEQKVLRVHPYEITKPKTDVSRWQTYVRRDGEKRKIVRAPSLNKLIDKLYDFYFVDIPKHDLTLNELFREWLPYKECITDSLNTIRRHEQHWNKYFKNWIDNKVKSYDKLELQKQCNLLVKEFNMSSKEWQNVKTILSGMFQFAFDKEYINSNPMKDIKISVKFRQVNKKTGSEETFQTNEKNVLMNYFDIKYQQTGDSVYLALKLDFYLGLRVGELSSLKWRDIVGLKDLHVCREEVKTSVRNDDTWADTYEVVDHTKTHTDRIVPLIVPAIALLNQLRESLKVYRSEDYIFMRNGERITSRQITYALEKACENNNIPVKRTHKIRKTVASNLNAGGVPLDGIREFLGHSNSETTLGYIFNPLSERETYNKISKAL